MVNQQMLEGNWNQIKGKLKQRWGQLSNDDLDRFEGNIEQLVGLIQQKTGAARDDIESYLDQAVEGNSRTDDFTAQVQAYADQAAVSMQEAYEQLGEQFRRGYEEAENTIRSRPAESVAVAFGTGLIAGLIVGLVSRR